MEAVGYQTARAMAETKRRKLANNTYLSINEDGSFGVRFHDTQVVIFRPDGRIVLDSGGWRTVTTKARMNEALDGYWRLWQENGVWYINCPDSKKGPFAYADGMTLRPDEDVEGEGEDPKAQKQLRRKIKAYAKSYLKALFSGEVPAPSAGDCFGCAMITESGETPLGGADHILSHIEESYYVPSLLLRAIERFPASQYALGVISQWASGSEELPKEVFSLRANGGNGQGIGSQQIEKSLRRYLYEQTGSAC